VRVIDALAIHEHEDGEVDVLNLDTLHDDGVELGATIGALAGLGVDGAEGAGADGARLGAHGRTTRRAVR
jgi:hypothetical protein